MQPATESHFASSAQQPPSRHVAQSPVARMPEQSTGSPPPVPVVPVVASVAVEPVVTPLSPPQQESRSIFAFVALSRNQRFGTTVEASPNHQTPEAMHKFPRQIINDRVNSAAFSCLGA